MKHRVYVCVVGMALWLGLGVMPAAADSPTVKALLADAAPTKQWVMVEFSATWCSPCRYFNEQVLPLPQIQAALANVRFAKYDVDADAVGEAEAQRLGINGFPTFVVYDGSGALKFIGGGAMSTFEFLGMLASVGLPTVTPSELEQRAPASAVARLLRGMYHEKDGNFAAASLAYQAAETQAGAREPEVAAQAAWRWRALRFEQAQADAFATMASAYLRAFPKAQHRRRLYGSLIEAKHLPLAERKQWAAALIAESKAGDLVGGAREMLAEGLYSAAVSAYTKFLDSEGKDAWGYELRALAHALAGAKDAALGDLQEALALAKRDDERQRLTRKIAAYRAGNFDQSELEAKRRDGIRRRMSSQAWLLEMKGEAPTDASRHAFEFDVAQALVACRASAGRADELIVRLGVALGQPPKVEQLYATPLSASLARCARQALAKLVVPTLQHQPAHLTIVVPFTPEAR